MTSGISFNRDDEAGRKDRRWPLLLALGLTIGVPAVVIAVGNWLAVGFGCDDHCSLQPTADWGNRLHDWHWTVWAWLGWSSVLAAVSVIALAWSQRRRVAIVVMAICVLASIAWSVFPSLTHNPTDAIIVPGHPFGFWLWVELVLIVGGGYVLAPERGPTDSRAEASS